MDSNKGIRELLLKQEREMIYGKALKDTIDNLIEKGKIKPYKEFTSADLEDFKETLKNLK